MAHGLFYPPKNDCFQDKSGHLPPLLVKIHGYGTLCCRHACRQLLILMCAHTNNFTNSILMCVCTFFLMYGSWIGGRLGRPPPFVAWTSNSLLRGESRCWMSTMVRFPVLSGCSRVVMILCCMKFL